MSSSTTSPKKHEPAQLSRSATRRLKRSEDLTLHAGITCGMVSRVIVGIPSLRLDYFVAGDCLKELGALLDEAKSGQLGLSAEVINLFRFQPSTQFKSRRRILYREHLEALRTDATPHGGLNRGSTAASTVSLSPYHMDVDTSLLPLFINQSVLLRIRASSVVTPTPILQTLTRRVTDFKSEYRTLSVLFVKPLSEFDVQEAQIYTEEFLKSLKANHGVFHQCSVDDKGQTFLACFGLPPYANESGCHNAVKTSIDFQAALEHRAPGSRFSIAIATGNIFFGTLGTRGRKEAGLLGDVFNLAVRLLSIKREHQLVAIDKLTNDAVKKDFVCFDLGIHKVKGKDQEVEVWGIPTDGRASRSRLKREFNDPMGNLENLSL
ncbi:nucleotide cyclase [Chytridium lagenaria]|nr:nucleotide cyclase [Chytridium lagenaria]